MPEWDVTPRRAADSQVELVQLMTVVDANNVGNVHGGTIMKLVDTAAGLAAARHCGGLAVTAAMDEMVFLEPVYVNDLVTVRAMVNDAGRTSMEVGVRVEAEGVGGHRRVHTASAYLVYVALDEQGKPRPVPPVVADSEEERQRQREAKLRREARLSRKEAIQAIRPGREAPTTRRPRSSPGRSSPG
jgi:acyl-CoA hydrolase